MKEFLCLMLHTMHICHAELHTRLHPTSLCLSGHFYWAGTKFWPAMKPSTTRQSCGQLKAFGSAGSSWEWWRFLQLGSSSFVWSSETRSESSCFDMFINHLWQWYQDIIRHYISQLYLFKSRSDNHDTLPERASMPWFQVCARPSIDLFVSMVHILLVEPIWNPYYVPGR